MNKDNCLICGKPLQYFQHQEDLVCSICGGVFPGNAQCVDGHFVCDDCHREKGLEIIRRVCRNSQSKNPLQILKVIMEQPYIYMHGPEHHIMVGAALLTAYVNADGALELDSALEEMIRRGGQVSGGFCGFWGCCGAAVSSGIFLALITGSTPLLGEPMSLSQRGTALALERIADMEAPRCCKRNSFISTLSTIEYVKERTGVIMEGSAEDVQCDYSKYNDECIGKQCPFLKRIADDRKEEKFETKR